MIEGRCAACKYLRRRCAVDCVFSPHFPPKDPQKFASVHKIYGAGNVAKLLQQLPENVRAAAADSLHYEAECRVEDPVYGCVKLIYTLQQQIFEAENQIAQIRAQMALHFSGEFQPY